MARVPLVSSFPLSPVHFPLFTAALLSVALVVDGVDHAVHHVAVEVGATARFDCRTCPLAVNKWRVSFMP